MEGSATARDAAPAAAVNDSPQAAARSASPSAKPAASALAASRDQAAPSAHGSRGSADAVTAQTPKALILKSSLNAFGAPADSVVADRPAVVASRFASRSRELGAPAPAEVSQPAPAAKRSIFEVDPRLFLPVQTAPRFAFNSAAPGANPTPAAASQPTPATQSAAPGATAQVAIAPDNATSQPTTTHSAGPVGPTSAATTNQQVPTATSASSSSPHTAAVPATAVHQPAATASSSSGGPGLYRGRASPASPGGQPRADAHGRSGIDASKIDGRSIGIEAAMASYLKRVNSQSPPEQPLPPKPNKRSTVSQQQELLTNARIYQQLLDLCSPPAKTGWYAQVPAAPLIRQGTADPAGVLQLLRKNFQDDELRRAGVLVRPEQAGGENRLNPDLSDPQRQWIALSIKNYGLWDIIGAGGSLRADGASLLQAAHDQEFRRAARETRTVFVTETVEDMAVFRSLGLAACAATGLDQVRREHLDRFEKLVGKRDYNAEAHLGGVAPLLERLVLVNWSVAKMRLEPAPLLDKVAAEFRDLYEKMHIDGANAFRWQITADELETIRFIVSRAVDPDEMADNLVGMADRSALPLIGPPPPVIVPLAQLYQKLVRTAFQPGNEIIKRQQQEKIQEEIKERIVNPLIAAAQECQDPAEATQLYVAAHLSGELQDRLFERKVRMKKQPDWGSYPEARKEMQELISMSKQFQALTQKKVDACASPHNRPGPSGRRFPWKR
jgi:hypothetical protein